MDVPESPKRALTIYDVARSAGVSIASVSRVLNGHDNPRPETRERVLRAVRDLGFVPDGAARALSNRFKEVVGVVFRRLYSETLGGPGLEDEDESLLFNDVINRGVEIAATGHGFDVLVTSVDVFDTGPHPRVDSAAGKSDGLILHDRVLDPVEIVRLARRVPIVTLAGTPTASTVNIRSDNESGMRALALHLIGEHGHRSLAYLSGHGDSPDNLDRAHAIETVAAGAGVEFRSGPEWHGNYMASGGARAVAAVLDSGAGLPDAILCANDQTAIGALHELGRAGIRVPDDVAVTGFDDIPVARHLHPRLTTVRQPIQRMGAAAFDAVYGMISGGPREQPEVVLPTTVVIRASCGCQPPNDENVPTPESGPTQRDPRGT